MRSILRSLNLPLSLNIAATFFGYRFKTDSRVPSRIFIISST